MRPMIAILDDDVRMARVLGMVLESLDADIKTFHDPRVFLKCIDDHEAHFDLVITDLKMPHLDGLQVLARLKIHRPSLPVILITAHGSIATAIEAMKQGAFDFILKPFDNTACRAQAWRALEMTRLQRENAALRREMAGSGTVQDAIIIAPAMKRAYQIARRAAHSTASVLIQGESGTGKEVIARAIHYYSPRVGEPFVAVNCKALSEDILESELFGHVRGAFTGALHDRTGLFERAQGGTLFLDEIGEISPNFQGKLLRVLQERVIEPVGSSGVSRPIDVRIIAATNRQLAHDVHAATFREDLFYRLAVIPIDLPALRDRREEVLPLARHFFTSYCELSGRALQGWDAEVEAYLITHDWPGNVRELENVVERGVIMAQGEQMTREDLLLSEPASDREQSWRNQERSITLEQALARTTRQHVQDVLLQCEGQKSEAARRLGIDRATLYRLLKRHDIPH